MTVSRDAVFWGFRLVLGREPESEDSYRAHLGVADERELVEVLLKSAEFRNGGRFSDVMALRAGLDEDPPAAWSRRGNSRLKAAMFGNCQVGSLVRLMQAMTGDVLMRSFETTPDMLARLASGELDIGETLRRADVVFVQHVGEVTRFIEQHFPGQAHKLRQFPPVAYAGFHPDSVYVRYGERYLTGPVGEYHSAIALWGWRHGLDVQRTVDLFRGEVFESLGYASYAPAGYRALVELGRGVGFPLAGMIDRWQTLGCWMHTINHPKIAVLADVARELLRREGVAAIAGTEDWVEDPLLRWPVWPVYPELASAWGLAGSYTFKMDSGLCPARQPVMTLDLPGFVEACFNTYRRHTGPALECPRIDTAPYTALAGFVRERPSRLRSVVQAVARALTGADGPAPQAAANPYQGLPDVAFWKRAVAAVPAEQLDPVVATGFRIGRQDRVATAGSCFAQHIARTLQREGFSYLVVDEDATLTADERTRRGIGMYSARYGNLYTTRQLLQLFDRAFGDFQPAEPPWQRPDGRFVDPWRPQIEPDGFASAEEVAEAARQHLAQVRQMFETLDVFVFTLGLTEAWRSREDGAVFPLAPGVVAGGFDPERHEFVNFGAAEVEHDLRGFVARLRAVNPGARMVLTVSPVPLIATRDGAHVLPATVYSKSVLRSAAGAVARELPQVDYFPSYEIITSAAARGGYFEPDLRSVTESGVAHVMRVFLHHYAGESTAEAAKETAPLAAVVEEQRRLSDIVCDEEAIDRHRT